MPPSDHPATACPTPTIAPFSRATRNIERVFTDAEKRNLRGQSFRGDLDRVDFAMADLREASFESASLTECDFRGADLRGATFVACDLRQASFDGAEFGNNRFDRTLLAGVVGVGDARQEIERAGGVFTPACSSLR
jgi:uncharacterized protein YjbI with pentapeptide repeats